MDFNEKYEILESKEILCFIPKTYFPILQTEIISVKRLADGVIFNLNQIVIHKNGTIPCKIVKFNKTKKEINVFVYNVDGDYNSIGVNVLSHYNIFQN